MLNALRALDARGAQGESRKKLAQRAFYFAEPVDSETQTSVAGGGVSPHPSYGFAVRIG